VKEEVKEQQFVQELVVMNQAKGVIEEYLFETKKCTQEGE